MNHQFDELTKGLARSVTCRGAAKQCGVHMAGAALSSLALGTVLTLSAYGDDFRRGAVINLSEPDALAACGSDGAQKECSIAVNSTNPKNVVVTWIGGGWKSIGGAVTFDGGKRWQQFPIPGLSVCGGGTTDFGGNADPWLSFSGNGELYHLCLAGNSAGRNAVLVSKSTDGGQHWNDPTRLWDTTDKRSYADKSSVTADRTDARYVYAIWDNCANGNRGQALFTRTTDGGRTWEPARIIYDPGVADGATLGHIINVERDGTLVDVFAEFKFSDDGTHKGALLSAIRSTDKGLSWSAPVRAAAIPVFSVVAPETGTPVVNSSSCCPNPAVALDPVNGNLYTVWEDTRFSDGQYSSIALAMSGDGGLTWSAPIQVNRTPNTVPPANRQAFIPGVAVAADGTIGVTYYDFRFNDANPGVPTDYWLVHCHPSATRPASDPANWDHETRLTDTSFDVNIQLGNPSGVFFLGDYQGLTTAGNDFLAAWTQMHGTDLNSIFFRRVGP